uniref:Uncharacterized protein n=1 Tax=Pundamilia nyererei TaxID=303518 RepID=A0A3B4H436_9CICH
MLCVCGLHAVLSPFMNSSWSACRLQPEVKPLPCQQDLLLQLMCSYLLLEEGEQFDLTMDTQKLGGGGECCFYRWQEFRKQFDLPEGGKFHIQASKVCVREAETEVKEVAPENCAAFRVCIIKLLWNNADFHLTGPVVPIHNLKCPRNRN